MARLGSPNDANDAQPKGPNQRRLGRVLDRILDVYGSVDAGMPADKALKNVFARSRDLGSRERAEVGDALFGLLRSQRRLQDHLHRAAKAERRDYSVLDTPVKHRMMVLAWLADGGATLEDLEATDRYAARRLPKVFARIINQRLPPVKKRAPVEALAIELSLPTWLVIRLVDAFGEERTRILGEALAVRAPVTLRVNPARANRDEVLAQIQAELVPEAKATLLSPWGITLPRSVDLPSWDLYKAGALQLQDEGSQLIALAAGVQPGMSVLDACAGAGGKTLAMGALMQGRGRLAALEPDRNKLGELKRRAARIDLAVEPHAGSMEARPEEYEGAFDVTMVDAPCTGTGTLRRAPDLAFRLTESNLERDVSRQKLLVGCALHTLKPGGRLVYATCSVLHEENEAIVQHILQTEPRLKAAALSEVWGQTLADKLGASHEARIGPGPGARGPDGFYVATLRRTDG